VAFTDSLLLIVNQSLTPVKDPKNQTHFEVMWFLLDLHSGALSHGEEFINVYKTHPDLFNSKDFALYKQIKVPGHEAW
jgi:hypothetical protein